MQTDCDVLIIGGGIIGASAALHTTCAGYRTILVEQGDYASATSSRTSRMHNCGFMYFLDAHRSLLRFLSRPRAVLKALELARRSMRDRASIVQTSPDRVRKVEFLIPFEPGSALTPFRMRIAARVLQALGGPAVSLEPAFLSADKAARHPLLRLMGEAGELRGAFSFAEYQYNWPERIVLDTIGNARTAGLDARNYTKVVALTQDQGGWRATLQQDGTTAVVHAKAVINAAGAWVDHVTRLASNSAPALNAGAKGVNLLVRLPDEARGLGMETVTARGTPFYIMPWGDHHYLGPADSPADAARTEFRATDGEIAQILADANALFPQLALKPRDVVYSWAGVRPRTAAPGEPLGSLDVREHDLTDQGLPNNVVFTGGLIMTHRDAGRRLAAAIGRRLPPSRAAQPVDDRLRRQPDEDRVCASSVRRAIEDEQARTLSDILRRRLSVGWDPDLGLSQAETAAGLAADLLGWDADEQRRQVAAYRVEVERSFRPAAAATRAAA